MINEQQPNLFRSKLLTVTGFVLFAMLMATLACSLTRAKDPEKPTQTPITPTADVNANANATIAARPTDEGGSPAPVLTIGATSPESPLTLGDTLTIELTVEHETGATAITLQPIRLNPPPGTRSRLDPIVIPLSEPQPSLTRSVEWTPDVADEFTLQITAVAGLASSEVASLSIVVEGPTVEGPQPTVDLGPCIATTNTSGASVRSAASGNSTVLFTLAQSVKGEVVGRNRDSSGQGWFFIELIDDAANRSGWISVAQVDTEGGCDDVPLRE